MKEKNNVFINNPLVFIFLSGILSSFTYELYFYNKLMAVLIGTSLFFLIIWNLENYIKICVTLFLVIFIINVNFYFDYKPGESEIIRVTKLNYNFGEGELEGRKISINIENANEDIVGSRIYVNGDFTKNINIVKGKIGHYNVTKYTVLKDDFISYLYKLRKNIYEKIEEKIGKRKAAIICAVSYGYDYIDDNDRDEMKLYGIAHVVSVSGLHMVLIYSIVCKIFNSKVASIISLLYMFFSGAAEPSVRAYIMLLILTCAIKVRRNYNVLSALSLSGIIILIFKPYCIFKIGFILSFINILAIYYFNKKLNRVFYKLPKKLREVVAMSLSSQIFIFPISVLYFNETSVNFILGNLIIVPIINILIIVGILIMCFIKVPFIFGYLLYISSKLIVLMDRIIAIFDRYAIDFFYLNFGIAYLYISMIIAFYFYKKGIKRFLYYPIVMLFYVLILLYSPVVNIKYYYKGGLLISYRGERTFIESEDSSNVEKYKKVTLANKVIKANDKKNIIINNHTKLIFFNNNYILKSEKEEKVLKVSYDKINGDYDIIDFTRGDIQDIWIIDGNVISRK